MKSKSPHEAPPLHAVVLVACAFAASVALSQEASLPQLLPLEADITAAPGRVELELPDEVVAACRPDLSDLRIFDLEDKEVAFAFDAAPPLGTPTPVPQVAEAKILEVEREEVHRKDGPPLYRESYEIAVPKDPPSSGAWELQVDSSRPHFVRQARVESVEGGEVLVSTESVFRMPGATKLRLSLPNPNLERLRVTLEGEDGFFLEPRFSFHSERSADARAPIIVTLDETSRQTRGSRTVVVVNRPSGIVPERMRIETTSAWFDRAVEIWDVRQGVPDRRLGSGRVRRSKDTKEPDEREVLLEAALGQELRIEIEGGDSPALTDLKLVAIAPRPRLIFVATSAAADGRVGRLRFGGGRVNRPRYDISVPAGARPGEPSDSAAVPSARLGGIRRNPAYQAAPSLGFAMRPGTVVDHRLYAQSRSIVADPSAEGLSKLRLDVSDLAVTRPDLADLRIVDVERRQWPYLVNQATKPEEIPLAIQSVTHDGGTSRYVFVPPAAPIVLRELVIDTDAPFIDRAYELRAVARDREARAISAGKLDRSVGDRTPPRIKFAPQRLDSLELIVKNGDDSPIDIRRAHSAAELPEVLLVAPAGEYTLLLNYPDAEAPQYEIAQVRDRVITAPAGEVRKGALLNNPEFSQRARLAEGAALRTVPQILLWAALLIAVAVLGIVTARIVRSEPPAIDSP